jgi:hypothetical protein
MKTRREKLNCLMQALAEFVSDTISEEDRSRCKVTEGFCNGVCFTDLCTHILPIVVMRAAIECATTLQLNHLTKGPEIGREVVWVNELHKDHNPYGDIGYFQLKVYSLEPSTTQS